MRRGCFANISCWAVSQTDGQAKLEEDEKGQNSDPWWSDGGTTGFKMFIVTPPQKIIIS